MCVESVCVSASVFECAKLYMCVFVCVCVSMTCATTVPLQSAKQSSALHRLFQGKPMGWGKPTHPQELDQSSAGPLGAATPRLEPLKPFLGEPMPAKREAGQTVMATWGFSTFLTGSGETFIKLQMKGHIMRTFFEGETRGLAWSLHPKLSRHTGSLCVPKAEPLRRKRFRLLIPKGRTAALAPVGTAGWSSDTKACPPTTTRTEVTVTWRLLYRAVPPFFPAPWGFTPVYTGKL